MITNSVFNVLVTFSIVIWMCNVDSLGQNDLYTVVDRNKPINTSTLTPSQVIHPTNIWLLNRTIEPSGNISGLTPKTKRYSNESGCRIFAVDEFLNKRIRMKVAVEKMTLIEYRLSFVNYTINPLRRTIGMTHKADTWTRVSSLHGRTLLSLAFNYGIVSLMTLTISTDIEHVDLADFPRGCFDTLTDEAKMSSVESLLMHDFQFNNQDTDVSLVDDERICSEVIVDHGGYAHFTDRCCFKDRIEGSIHCETDFMNIYLRILYMITVTVRFGVIFFGPLLFLGVMKKFGSQDFPYIVQLKDPSDKSKDSDSNENPSGENAKVVPYTKTIKLVTKKHDSENVKDLVKAKHTMNLSNESGFPRLKRIVQENPDRVNGPPFVATISEYAILVNYNRLLRENNVHIGLWTVLAQNIFGCRLRELGPFKKCCDRNLFGLTAVESSQKETTGLHVETDDREVLTYASKNVSCIQFWRKCSVFFAILLIPTPYYLRIVVLYLFEYREIIERRLAASRVGLHVAFEYNIVHHLLPTHPLLVGAYIMYFCCGLIVVYHAYSTYSDRSPVRTTVVDAFRDLSSLSWIRVISKVISNIVWPFERFGIYGSCLAVVYWPLIIPLTSFVYLCYCIPTVYLTVRLFVHSKRSFFERLTNQQRIGTCYHNHIDEKDYTLKFFKFEHCWRMMFCENKDEAIQENYRECCREKKRMLDRHEITVRDRIECVITWVFCVLTILSILLILSECIGFTVELVVFTIMGIIVNSTILLKYIALLLLMVVYSYECFSNIGKRYTRMNKELFKKINETLRKDIENVSFQLSDEQMNHGFKCEVKDGKEDDIGGKQCREWLIHNLVLFIDNEDTPQIPRRLFDQVCNIQVPGVPGPVYHGLLMAMRRLITLLAFIILVFLVVFSFGDAYNISSTNQMIAALAGGSLPLIFRTLMVPDKTDIEISSISFHLRENEVIQQFNQLWPIIDFTFKINTQTTNEGANAPQSTAGTVQIPNVDGSAPFGGIVDSLNESFQYMDAHMSPMNIRRDSIPSVRETLNKDGVRNLSKVAPAPAGSYGSRPAFGEAMTQTKDDVYYCDVVSQAESASLMGSARPRGSMENLTTTSRKEGNNHASNPPYDYVSSNHVPEEIDLLIYIPETSSTKKPTKIERVFVDLFKRTDDV